MAQNVELILLQRIEKLGQMGDLVRVRPGYARNYLLPGGKALRASKENRERFEGQRAQLEAQNIKRREEAERLAERMSGLTVAVIRAAGEHHMDIGQMSSLESVIVQIADMISSSRPGARRENVEIYIKRLETLEIGRAHV